MSSQQLDDASALVQSVADQLFQYVLTQNDGDTNAATAVDASLRDGFLLLKKVDTADMYRLAAMVLMQIVALDLNAENIDGERVDLSCDFFSRDPTLSETLEAVAGFQRKERLAMRPDAAEGSTEPYLVLHDLVEAAKACGSNTVANTYHIAKKMMPSSSSNAQVDQLMSTHSFLNRGNPSTNTTPPTASVLPEDTLKYIQAQETAINHQYRFYSALRDEIRTKHLATPLRLLLARRVAYDAHRDERLPDQYYCPITNEVMSIPARLNGRLYEREAILNWIKKNGNDPIERDRKVLPMEVVKDNNLQLEIQNELEQRCLAEPKRRADAMLNKAIREVQSYLFGILAPSVDGVAVRKE